MLTYNSTPMPLKATTKPVSITLSPTTSSPMTAATPSLNSAAINGHKTQGQQHIWLVTGPAGCGKTTVAGYLAQSLGLPYIEGDSVCRTFAERPTL